MSGPDEVDGRRWTLLLAAAVAAAEAVVLLAALVARGDDRPVGGPVAGLVVKLGFCWGVTRRGPGSFLALLVYEGAALLFAVAATGSSAQLRVAVAVMAGTVLGLLAASARLFPTVTLPKP